MSKAGQLMIALICGMERDHPIVRNLMADTKVMASDLLAGLKIDGQDLFEAIDGRHSFFEYPEIWNHMAEVMEVIHKSGGKIEAQSFTEAIVNGKSALDFAIEKDAVKILFQPEIWKGHQGEMERVWFRVPSGKRSTDFFLQLRRDMAKAENRVIREDRLEAMGITQHELRSAVREGNYDIVRKKLTKHGDYLHASDIMLLDAVGDCMVDTAAACRNFGRLHDELARNGECLTVENLLFSSHGRRSPLEMAISENQLDKFFTPVIWRNRLDDMMKLLEHVPESKRKDLNIDDVIHQLEEEIYASRIQIAPGLSKGTLTEIMNDAAAAPVRGLGLKKIWDEMPAIRKILKQNSESITVSDLHLPCGREGETAMVAAARFGKFDLVIDMLVEQNAPLTVADLCGKGKSGKSLLDILIQEKQLHTVMKPELWVDRRDEFKTVWAALPDKSQEEIGYKDFVSQMNFIALRRKFGSGHGTSPAP